MRVLAAIMLLLITGCAHTPSLNPPPRVTTDRSWVPDNAVIYGQDPQHGFFRFVLNQQQPETLGSSIGFWPQTLLMSPNKTEVYAEATGTGSTERHFLFETKTNALRNLGSLIPPFASVESSPHWHYFAWTKSGDPDVHIVDLHSNTARTIHWPAHAGTGWVLTPAWSTAGQVLVVRRPLVAGSAGWTYWKIDPATDRATQIAGKNYAGVMYIENDAIIHVSCVSCGDMKSANRIKTPSGAVAYFDTNHNLVVKDPNGALNIVQKNMSPPASPPVSSSGKLCGCGTVAEYPTMWTIFDGDILLYSFGRDLWIYGIKEHEKSSLGLTPIEFVY